MQNDVLKRENPRAARRSSARLETRCPETDGVCKTELDRERITNRVASAIVELHTLQELLASEDVDPRLLTDFRDALNRTRNTAWGYSNTCLAVVFRRIPVH